MTSVEYSNPQSDNFTKDFEEYRRARRTRFQEQNSAYENEVDIYSSEEEEEEQAKLVEEIRTTPPRSPPTTAPIAQCNTTLPSSNAGNYPVVAKVKKSSNERRNSLTKFVTFCSSAFKTTPQQTPEEKHKAKLARKKREQDQNMAHLIAQLEFEGKSDAEIHMHLFHLRDLAQNPKPKNSLFGDLFRDMHQAFKDEFSVRRSSQTMSVSVSSVNPFTGAMPANYVHDSSYTYENLVLLEPVPRGLQSADHLPTVVYEGQELPSEQVTCAVCMADFETSEDLRSLACTHHFHKECIDKWLGVSPSCPVCKGEVSSA